MGDPTRYLLPGETAVIGERRHFMVLGVSFVETVGFIAIALMLTYLFETVNWVGTIGALIVLVSALRFGYHLLEWRMERYVITRQRMMLVSGVLTRRVAVIPMVKITDLTYEKPVVGQLFGYGTFIVESAGQDQAMSRITYLPKADVLYRRISHLLFGDSEISDHEDEYDESRLVPVPHETDEQYHSGEASAALDAFRSYDDPHEYPTGPIDVRDATSSDSEPGTVGKLSDAFTESRPPRWTRHR
ncbi:membrane protein YdbS with pleckstrin-like domain [Antricoccus suffuscus]|uniref:Membrane protein YdbS with pleckstrin-like domain n=1 Tax=Antricoccus suffuscus TaxID=1629062 RepID=A0A2T0ZQD3_9ACTN|nr:PH domain-containing protein [Antricoccus suffuscus]PRZ38569.1 membrane protein YdbS with pleckstrin-like domain [Antricoccus suffuscus]